jgi:hypothetical protein
MGNNKRPVPLPSGGAGLATRRGHRKLSGGAAFISSPFMSRLFLAIIAGIALYFVFSSTLFDDASSSEYLELLNLSLLSATAQKAPGAVSRQIVSPIITATLPSNQQPCHFVIETGTFDFHQEFIESLVAKFPVAAAVELPERCNHHPYVFHVKQGANRPRNRDWREFANQHMINRVYKDDTNKERRFAFVGATYKKFMALNVTYQARILLSCYCVKEDLVQVINTPNTYCYFHEACPEMLDHPRAYWAHPSQPRVVFPTVQPEMTRPSLSGPDYEFCVVGSVYRRDWTLLEDLVAQHRAQVSTKMSFHLLGKGDLPGVLVNGTNADAPIRIRQTTLESYYDFEAALATNCHVMLALVSQTMNQDYFMGSNETKLKVTAAMVHAAAYQIPTIVHEELYPLYKKYLPEEVETHSDTAASFTNAVLKMLARLDAKSG